jgi:hypothetical protein
VLNPRAALLSNYEVLTWLRELESEHLLRTKTALRVKKEDAAAVSMGDNVPGPSAHLEASENLRTVEVEVSPLLCQQVTNAHIFNQAIGYLAADYVTTTTQSEEGITNLVKNLAPYELTKAEKLQIVNLTPTLPVELYVVDTHPSSHSKDGSPIPM